MALTPITGEIQAQPLNDNFSYLGERIDNLAIYNVKDYDAVGDGITDDTTAIKAAIAALPAYGGIIFFPTGKYLISSKLNIGDGNIVGGTIAWSTTRQIQLIGSGAGIGNTTMTAGTEIIWGGAAGGTMIQFNGMYAGKLVNMRINENNLADCGLSLIGTFNSTFDYLSICNPRVNPSPGAIASLMIDGYNNWNQFAHVHVTAQNSGTSAVMVGITDLMGQSSNVFIDCYFNYAGDVAASYGLYLGFADNNSFYEVYTQQTGLNASGWGLYFAQCSGANAWAPGENSFYSCSIMAAPGRSIGGISGTAGNWFYSYSTGDGETIPILDNLHAITYDGKIYDSGLQRRTIRQIVNAKSASADSTSSLTPVLLTGMTETLTTKASKLKITFTGSCSKTTAGAATALLYVDSGAIAESPRSWGATGYATPVSISAIVDVAAGSHTVEIKWYSSDANNATCDYRELIVEELY
ncbi:MAG: glycosyl hydrolase family 28-related protein [Candidatus Thermoplasmatota archaeon]|nr:glycosyl hydrolase family 28-related protein [Candidatus Thermoplasmatota archaeon]